MLINSIQFSSVQKTSLQYVLGSEHAIYKIKSNKKTQGKEKMSSIKDVIYQKQEFDIMNYLRELALMKQEKEHLM